MADENIYRSEK